MSRPIAEPAPLHPDDLAWLLEARAASGPARTGAEATMGTNPEIFSALCRLQAETGMGADALYAIALAWRDEGRIVAVDAADPWTNKALRLLARQAGQYPKTPTPGEIVFEEPSRDGPRSESWTGIGPYLAGVPETIPWLVRGWVFLHGITLVSGSPKGGKTTLIAAMLRAMDVPQTPFLGVVPSARLSLFVTEKGGHQVRTVLDGLTLPDIIDARSDLDGDILETIVAWSFAHPGGVVVIDTFAHWANLEDENDNAKVQRAMKALRFVVESCPVGIVLIHHANKRGGEHGEAIRGASALFAAVDHSIEVTFGPGVTQRYLDVNSNVEDHGRRILIDRDPLTGEYRVVDHRDVDLGEIEGWLRDIPADGPGMTRGELARAWQIAQPRTRIDRLLNQGRMRTEVGKRPSGQLANLYWAKVAVPKGESQVSYLGGVVETTTPTEANKGAASML